MEQLDLFADVERKPSFMDMLTTYAIMAVVVFGMGACVVGTVSEGIKCRQAVAYEDSDGINKHCID